MKICVIGLGYVGLPLAVEYAKAGFKVTGLDLNDEKVTALNSGKSYIPDIPSDEIKKLREKPSA